MNLCSDEEFMESLQREREYGARVADWLKRRGYDTVQPPLKIRPTVEERGQYRDDGDILISGKVEVKVRGFDFTSRETYPYDSIMLGETHQHRGKPAVFYAILNKDGTHAAIIPVAKTRKDWKVVNLREARSGGMKESYTVDKRHAWFIAL